MPHPKPSFRIGPTRNRRSFGLTSESSASDENEAASLRELARNKAAAEQIQRMRQDEVATMDARAGQQRSSEAARIALAIALGHNPASAPSMSQLTARFYSLPPSVQAGIYSRGGAHFIDPVAGSKMIDDLGTNREKQHDALTIQMGEQLASGRINYDLSSDKKPSFYREVEDPADPLGKRKLKKPLNTFEIGLIERGVQKGFFPNPDGTTESSPTPYVKPQSRMSSEEFQKVLDARENAQNNTVPRLAANKSLASTPVVTSTPTPTPSIIPPRRYGVLNDPNSSSLLSVVEGAGRNIGAMLETVGNLGKGFMNIPANLTNRTMDYLYGDEAGQPNRTFKQTPNQLNANDAAAIAARLSQQNSPPLDLFDRSEIIY